MTYECVMGRRGSWNYRIKRRVSIIGVLLFAFVWLLFPELLWVLVIVAVTVVPSIIVLWKRKQIGEMVFDYREEKRRKIIEKENTERDEKRIEKDILLLDAADIFNSEKLSRYAKGVKFEETMVRIFTILGYKVMHTGKAGDQGCDFILSKDDRRIAVQAKNMQGNTGNDAVQEAISAREMKKANEAWVVTTANKFTNKAKELARGTDVKLFDKKHVLNWMSEAAGELRRKEQN